MEGTDSRYNDLEQSEPIYACAIKLEDMENGNYEIIDLMPSLSFDKVITWEAPKGPWKLFFFIERKASWYADVLNPETTNYYFYVLNPAEGRHKFSTTLDEHNAFIASLE